MRARISLSSPELPALAETFCTIETDGDRVIVSLWDLEPGADHLGGNVWFEGAGFEDGIIIESVLSWSDGLSWRPEAELAAILGAIAAWQASQRTAA